MPSSEKRQRQKENRAKAQAEAAANARSARRRKTAIRVGVIAVLGVGLLLLFNVIGGDDGDDTATAPTSLEPPTTTAAATPEEREAVLAEAGCVADVPEPGEKPSFEEPAQVVDESKTYVATLETSCGAIVAELDASIAPLGVNNFVFLAREGFYDGLTWHRVVSDFVIQGGDPDGAGTGGPGYQVVTETPEAGYTVGDFAYAKAGDAPNGSAGSQFFIVTGDTTALDQQVGGSFQYGSFGTVTEGIEVAQTLESLDDGTQSPIADVYIFSVTITEA